MRTPVDAQEPEANWEFLLTFLGQHGDHHLPNCSCAKVRELILAALKVDEHGRRQAALRRGAGQKGAPSGTQPRDVGRSSGDVHTKPVPGLGGPVRAAYPMATRLAISVLLLVAIGFFSVGYALMRPARRLALRKEMGDL